MLNEGGLPNATVQRACSFMSRRIESKISVSDVGRAVGLSAAEVNELFRKHLGTTPYAHFIGLRIQHAKELLKEGAEIASVAVAFGFVDQSHFTRHFKKHVGLAPGQYASRYRKSPARPTQINRRSK